MSHELHFNPNSDSVQKLITLNIHKRKKSNKIIRDSIKYLKFN